MPQPTNQFCVCTHTHNIIHIMCVHFCTVQSIMIICITTESSCQPKHSTIIFKKHYTHPPSLLLLIAIHQAPVTSHHNVYRVVPQAIKLCLFCGKR